MRSWDGHRRAAMVDGFSVDQSVLLQTGDHAGIERLVQYMVRCPLESVSTSQGNRYRTGCLQGRKGCLPGLSRSAVNQPHCRHETKFSDPLATRFPGGVHPAHSAKRLSYCPLLWSLFEQVKGNAEKGGRSGKAT
jgi:hypothetical protein